MVTKRGTSGADTIFGTGSADQLFGLAGDDHLYGRAGNDLLDGGRGVDWIDGGAGRDKLSYVNVGVDQFGLGVFVSLADNRVQSEVAGNDHIANIEDIDGTNFDDYLIGGFDKNVIAGRSGSDLLKGYGGRDSIHGGDGNDTIHGDYFIGDQFFTEIPGSTPGAADLLKGGAGNDEIEGDEGDDIIFGGPGFDRLRGELGSDRLHGGADPDEFIWGAGPPGEINSAENGYDVIEDFKKGEDIIRFSLSEPGKQRLGAFEDPASGIKDIDSNRNGVLDNADEFIDIRVVTHDGVSKLSTVIDVATYVTYDQGELTLVVFGVTGMTTTDFI